MDELTIPGILLNPNITKVWKDALVNRPNPQDISTCAAAVYAAVPLEASDLREVKIANLHSGYYHVETLLAAGTNRNAHSLDV